MLDPATGRKVWEQPLPGTASRFFVLEGRLFVLVDTNLLSFDRLTGAPLSTIKIPIHPSSIAVDGDCFYLADLGGAVCIRADGTMVWGFRHEVMRQAWEGDIGEEAIICRDARGEELWRMPVQTFNPNEGAGIVIGDQVVQPDRRG